MMMQGASKQWAVAGGAAFESECTAQTFIPVGLATDYCISTIIVIVTMQAIKVAIKWPEQLYTHL